jgi:hypothetical protein
MGCTIDRWVSWHVARIFPPPNWRLLTVTFKWSSRAVGSHIRELGNDDEAILLDNASWYSQTRIARFLAHALLLLHIGTWYLQFSKAQGCCLVQRYVARKRSHYFCRLMDRNRPQSVLPRTIASPWSCLICTQHRRGLYSPISKTVHDFSFKIRLYTTCEMVREKSAKILDQTVFLSLRQ